MTTTQNEQTPAPTSTALGTHTPLAPAGGDGRYVTTVTVNGLTYELGLNRWPYSSARKPANVTKLFVWGTEPSMPAPEHSHKGDNPLSDATWKAYNDLEKATQKAHLVLCLAAVGADVSAANFSQTAGCSACPCSPGFTLTGTVTVDGLSFRQCYVTLKAATA